MDRLTTLLPAWASTTTAAILVLTTGTIFTLIGPKNLPLGYTVRLLPSLYRIFRPRYSSSSQKKSKPGISSTSTEPSTQQSGPMTAAHPTIFSHHVTKTKAYLPDIDINVHKSNSTFFVDADISRAALLSSLLSDGLANLPPSGGKRPKPGMFLLAGVGCKFLRSIAPLEQFEVSSRILCWEEGPKGALFVVTYFLRSGMGEKLAGQHGREVEVQGGPAALIKDDKLRKGVFAVMVTRYVFKAGREGVAPEIVLRAAALMRDGDSGKQHEGGEWIDGESVNMVVRTGLEYVAGCML
ncbi:hypothetical protein QBC37DRAFT_424705 [Rhypophila decipiens]|uniref:Uncharacterized protein n=1 Tax=Rhypophila decipiens TaxID=261697 RepID=A0AAN7B4J3_9PEZI|nr:hypothetical protein QBC37DRAFT_424705 [Rhypophila decipiens]